MQTFKLLKPHTHAGKEYAAGDLIKVRSEIAARYPDIFGRPVKDAGAEPTKEG